MPPTLRRIRALVGHELSHSIDTRGAWSTVRCAARLVANPPMPPHGKCGPRRSSAQYDAYPYPNLTKVNVNGRLTREENIADSPGWNSRGARASAQLGLQTPAKQAFFRVGADLAAADAPHGYLARLHRPACPRSMAATARW